MVEQLAQLAVIGWLPGAAMYRVPFAERDRRAGLPAEERLFWQIVISLAISLSIVLALGAVGRYRFEYLLWVQAFITTVPVLVWRLRLRLGRTAPPPRLASAIPLILVVLCASRFLPPSEYIIGGKDPGVYVNEGVQLAQRGSIAIEDPLVAAVPASLRDLFFPSHGRDDYYGIRFMGFPIQDPDTGYVVGQFPHLFPAALAVGYGIDGLTGVRRTTPLLATLGVLAVYLFAAAVFGRTAAAAAALLLALNVIEAWFGRYPNTEVMMQLMLFAGLLAVLRWQSDAIGFFAPLSGVLLGLMLFLRIDGLLPIIVVTGGILLATTTGQRGSWTFFAGLALPLLCAIPYLNGPMRAYTTYPREFIANLDPWQHMAIGLGAFATAAALFAARQSAAIREGLLRWVPIACSVVIVAASLYALFLREPGGKLTDYNAYALRMFAGFYVTLPIVFAAVLGYAVYARHVFWRSPTFFLVVAAFGLFFFYKLRIVPEHFWAARRFVPVLLPATLILASAAAVGGRGFGSWPVRTARLLIGVVFLGLVASHYARASAPVADYVEFAGVVPQVEELARQIRDDDLLIVESRDAGGDIHIVGLPLAYIYARNVLVLNSARPDRDALLAFVDWARTRYARVLFLGGAGSDLVSTGFHATHIWRDRYEVPEYESVLNGYPRGPRARKFDYAVYQLTPGPADHRLDIDVGAEDDVYVVRFGGKEESEGRTFRWTAERSMLTFASLPEPVDEVVLIASDGGRPDAAPPARVEVWLDDVRIGVIEIDGPFRPYTLTIPPQIVSGDPIELRLNSVLWNPAKVLGSPDDRELGVMIDRVTVR
jgi:hypothetical protein